MKFPAMMLAVSLVLVACTSSRVSNDPTRLYVMDCGGLRVHDVAAFGLTNEETPVRELFVPCYLVDHPAGQLLWDAGLDPSIVGRGEVAYGDDGMLWYETSVIDQLATIGLAPDDVEYIALSHFHFDHAGAANYFPVSTLLIQDTEYDAAFLNYEDNPIFDYSYYNELSDNPRVLLTGDHDVFGDGRVRIVSAPGHTPGHQVLLLELENLGPLVLSGDLYHFRFSRQNRRVPDFNTDREDTLASMDRVEELVQETGATFWIEHDMALSQTLRKAPAYYD